MTAMPAVMREPTILDEPERRFPLDLEVRIPRIRGLFHAATKNQWDPKTDIPWADLDVRGVGQKHLMAAREYWSRRAWGEYGAISESPAILIRFCQRRIEPDLRLFFTIRSQEESRHAEVCYLMAEKLGGYVEKPYETGYQKSVATHGVRKMALDPNFSLEALIAALVCAAEEIAFDVFDHLIAITPNPVAKAVLMAVRRDEVRHCAFGWYYLEHKVKTMTPREIKEMEEAVIVMIEKVEMNGYHSAWLAPDNPASRQEVEADRLTWEAGLGATVEELEKPVFVGTIKRLRKQMAPWGVNLPLFRHPKIGEF
jgi:hypothetical protein